MYPKSREGIEYFRIFKGFTKEQSLPMGRDKTDFIT
jgi:hypothetical protein